VTIAAIADVYAGGGGTALLEERDPGRSLVLQAKALRAAEVSRRRDDRLAALIAHKVARALAGKRVSGGG
jgi:hypothetical protein